MNKWIMIGLVVAGCGGSGGSGVGVPECDAYLGKMRACATKLGGTDGDRLTRGAKMFEDSWKNEAKDASMKSQLPKTCSDATADAKKQMAQCEW